MTDDEKLMSLAAEGDMSAFAELVERHHRRALNIAYRFLSDADLAEDVVQDAFLKILDAADRYRPTARFLTYLYNVIWHLCIDTYRKKTPRSLDAMPVGPHTENPPDRRALEEERARAVQDAIAQLPERQRMALVLQHYDELSYEEIADSMGCSSSAVDSLLVRARRTLKTILDDKGL